MAQGREVEVKFRRDLGLLEITMIGLGPTIGTTIFLLVGPGYAITGPSLILAFGLNFVGTKLTGRSETAVTIALVAIVISFIIAGLLYLTHAGVPAANFQPFLRGGSPPIQFVSLLGAMGFTFIVFEGYEIIAQTGEEVRNPEKNIPRAVFIVIGLSTLIFILVAFVAIGSSGNCGGGPRSLCFLFQPSRAGPIGNNNAIAEIAAQVMPYGTQIIVLGVTLGAIAALNSLIFSSSRVAFAMGRDGGLPRILGKLHARKRTPHVAIAVSGLIIVFITLTLDLNTVAASADVMFLLLFLMVNWAAIVLRRTMPDVKRYYLMPLFPLIPILGIATKFVLAISLWTIEPIAWVIALGWIGIGLAVHYLHERKEIVVGVTKVVESILPRRRPRYRILLPIEDFERVELVEFGALIAQVEDAELTLLHVIEVPPALPIDAIDRAYVSEVRFHLGKLRRRAEDLGAYSTARVDVSHKVFDSILDNIREDETDLLILGWRGGWRRGRIL